MIEMKSHQPVIEEVTRETPLQRPVDHVIERPEVVEARVYKLKSGFVNFSVYITLGFIRENGRIRPIEIFINSKDLTRAAEYAVLTRLISAIFRKSADPTFILEELKSIHDPNGGYMKRTGYVHSFYSEVAVVIEQFFNDIKELESQPTLAAEQQTGVQESTPRMPIGTEKGIQLQICPKCQSKTLRNDGGCVTCINPECNYSKCD